MKNLKKLFAVVIAVAMMVTAMAPAFAAGAFGYEAEAQVLNDLGLYKGISETEFVPDLGTALNRETGVVMLLRIFGLEADADAIADADAVLAKFKDAASISSWAKKAVAYAVENGLVQGLPDGTFGPKAALNGKAYCTLILRQLGYTPDYNNAPAELADKGGLTVLEAVKFTSKELIKDDLVGISYGALKAEYSDGATVIEKLIEANPDMEEVATTAGLVEEVTITELASVAAVKCKVGETPVLPKTVTATYSDKTTAEVAVTWGAVDTTKAGTVTVAGTVEGTELKASVTVTVEAVVLAVESVTAANLKEVVITFNKDLDNDSATTAGNYTFNNGLTAKAAARDGKTVTVTVNGNATQQNTYDVTVKNVKDSAGTAIADTTKSVKFFDATLPTAVSAEVTGPKTIKVTFSEPITSSAIATTSNFVVDNNTYSVASVAANGEKAVDVTLGSSLPAGSHTITVNNGSTTANPEIKDYAGFFVFKTPLTFNYAVDSAAPTVELVSAKQNEVKIKFNKAIDPAFKANLKVYHTYNNQGTYQGVNTWDSDNQTVTVAYAANYLPLGTATVYVSNSSSSAQVKDLWGNVFVDATLSASITADTTAPTVTKVEATSATAIEVTFSEAVTGANTATNYTLKDSSGTSVAVTSAVLKAGTTATYTLTTAQMNGGSYTLSINTNIKDTSVSTNAMAAYTGTVTVTDLVKPTVTLTGVYATDKKSIVVKFSEAMTTAGVYSIADKANYQVSYDNGTNWKDLKDIDGSAVVVNSANKSVTLTFTTAQTNLGGAADLVRVARVADAAGNVTAAFTTDVTLSGDDILAANITTNDKEKVTSNVKVEFVVDTTLSAIDVSKFTIGVDGNNDGDAGDAGEAKAATAVTYVNDATTATVTVTIADANKFKSDMANFVNVFIGANGLTTALGTKNSGGITVAKADFADYAAPVVVSTETGDADNDGHLDKITITYDEALYVASVAEADYTVEGYEVSGVSVAGAVVTLTIKELASFDTGVTPKVTLAGAVSDNSAQRNSLGAQAAVTSTDKAAPVMIAWAMNMNLNGDGKSIDLTFSEDVAKANLVLTKLDIQAASAVYAAGDFTVGTTAQTASNVITVTELGAAMVDAINTLDAINDSASNYYMAVGAGLAADGATNASVAANGVKATSFTADTTAPKIASAVATNGMANADNVITVTYDDYMSTTADLAANYTAVTFGNGTVIDGTAPAVGLTGILGIGVEAWASNDTLLAKATVVDIAGNAVDTSADLITFTNAAASATAGNNSIN